MTTWSAPSSVSSATTGLPEPVEPSADSSSSAERSSTKLPTIWPPAKPSSIRTRSSATRAHYFREHAVDGLRMDEGDLEAEHAAARRLVDQLGARVREMREGGADVIALVGDVVHAWAARGEDPTHGRLVAERAEQFEPAFPDADGRG